MRLWPAALKYETGIPCLFFSLHIGYALVYIIMNVCVLQRDESILCNQREIQTLICSDVHKLIIDNPYQAKLISFQVCSYLTTPT